eukprot:100662_1
MLLTTVPDANIGQNLDKSFREREATYTHSPRETAFSYDQDSSSSTDSSTHGNSFFNDGSTETPPENNKFEKEEWVDKDFYSPFFYFQNEYYVESSLLNNYTQKRCIESSILQKKA